MNLKSFIQLLILILIIIIIGGVYFKYFKTEKIMEENNLTEINNNQIKQLEKKISDLVSKNEELTKKIDNNKYQSLIIEEPKPKKVENSNNAKKVENLNKSKMIETDQKSLTKEKNKTVNNQVKNLVKDVEYTSVDKRGNVFRLLANSGKTNKDNNNILDLINVRGEINSDVRDTIYIVSNYAQYNSTNLNSKFYENVIINYQDKKITCLNFDINMETNKAIAYNNVIITDPKSVMKAGVIEFDLKTKDININPDTLNTKIKITKN